MNIKYKLSMKTPFEMHETKANNNNHEKIIIVINQGDQDG